RRMLTVVQDRLPCLLEFSVGAERLPGVRVAIPAREARRSDVDADAVSGEEAISRRPQIDDVLIGAAGLDRRRLLRIAIARADDAVGEVLRIAVRMDVHEPRNEVR